MVGTEQARARLRRGSQARSPDPHRLRANIAAKIPRRYSPIMHLAVPTTIGLLVMLGAISFVDHVDAIDLLAIPVSLLFAFAFEWWAHRAVLHRRTPLLGVLYERHELEHHLVFTADDMALRSPRELWLVLMPPYSVLLIFVVLLPLVVAASRVFSVDAALLGLATAMVFFVSYEWMHLAYHLPNDNAVLRLPGLARLREHHRRHHDPRLMKRWNFNVTVPVFDVLHGTRWSPASRRSPENADFDAADVPTNPARTPIARRAPASCSKNTP